jgi:hypothetical protein
MSKITEIPKEQEALFNMLLGMVSTLEKIRDSVFTLEENVSDIEDKLDSLIILIKEKNNTDFGNKVSKWLRNTKKQNI